MNFKELYIVAITFSLFILSCADDKAERSDSHSSSEMMREHEMANAFNPETATRLLRPEELSDYTLQQLRVMRNEIFARHGYVFKSTDLQRYFEEQLWYEADTSFIPEMLSEVEKGNVQAILAEEQKRLAAGLPADTKQVLETWGTRYAATLGEEEMPGFVDSWTMKVGDIDNDNDPDVIGLFYMSGGGNAVFNQIAVFKNDNGVLIFDATAEAGYTGNWIVDSLLSVNANRIVASTHVWLPDDANCCPQGRGYVAIEYTPGKLTLPKEPPTRSYSGDKEEDHEWKTWPEFY